MAFNFNISGVPTAKTSKTLELWAIHDVTFDGMEIAEGTSKAGEPYRQIKMKFKNDEGNVTLSWFWPNEKSMARRSFDGANGGKRWVASNAEELWEALKQAVAALSPKGFEKLMAASSKFKGFDDAIKAVNTVLKTAVGQTTQIKLGGYISGGYKNAALPSLLYVADETSEPSTSSIWIGDGLFFSDYEESQRTKFLEKSNAKPSNVEKKVQELNDTTTSDDKSDDDDVFSDLSELEAL